ncbi:unnamed protein product [Adineta steineri]|uniref:Uncharacterized protein n=1 Tax=Adineta steineri TaxID=433720 RepID=A0A814V2Q6_9BILA|nr:unnamed protein product [Adineta steineri]CAF3532624.1 unnamed protein product [Adineta steineri]
MNNLWLRNTSVSPTFDHHIENSRINETPINHSECPSYTLGFGHLFSGNLQYYPSFPYELGSFEVPKCNSNLNYNIEQMNNIRSQQDCIINQKVNEAMETIRNTIKNIEQQHNYSISCIPYQYNPIANNYSQSNITKAAALLERAAHAMSTVANTQSQFRS